jgi:hypothetical protein
MLAYYPGSTAAKRLEEFCQRLNTEPSYEFYGFAIRKKKVLFRRGLPWLAKTPAGKSWRWHFKKPFVAEGVDYILLQGPEAGEFREKLFLFTQNEAQAFKRIWPKDLDIPADPDSPMRGGRQTIWDHAVSFTKLRHL